MLFRCIFLRQLRHLRRYVTNDCFRSLVVSLVHSRLDYGNFVFVRPYSTLQLVWCSDFVATTDALAILHWLRLPERVSFKVALMAYRVLNRMAPSYLNLLVPVSNLPGRRRLRSSFTQQLLIPPYRLSTVGHRSFSVAASTFCNTLPNDI